MVNRQTVAIATIIGAIVYLGFAHPIGNLAGRFGLFAIVLGMVWILGNCQWLNPTAWKRWCIACVIGLLSVLLLIASGSFEKSGKVGENIVAFPADVTWQVLNCVLPVAGLFLVGVLIVWAARSQA